MYKEVEEKPEILSASVTIHGKNCMLTIAAREYKPELSLYDMHHSTWLDYPAFKGGLYELVERLQTDKATIEGLENTIKSLMQEISELEDNQVKEPVH
jgi:hypothetical protein